MKEVQRLQINPTNIREQTILTINNPDSGTFYAYIYDSGNNKNGPYTISGSYSASDMRSALISYYYALGGTITVSLVMYDSTGAVTTNSSASVQNQYTIQYQKATSTPTASKMTFTSQGSLSTIALELPV